MRGNDRDNVRDRRTRWGCAIHNFWTLFCIEMTNYQSAKRRIDKAGTKLKLEKLERSFMNLYNAGQLTVNEYKRLDSLIVDKYITLEK